MRHVRFVIVLALLAAGCALLIAAEVPRPVTAQWVGSGVHDASLHFLPRAETSTEVQPS